MQIRPNKTLKKSKETTKSPAKNKARYSSKRTVLAVLEHPLNTTTPRLYTASFLANETIVHYFKRNNITLPHTQPCELYLNQTVIPQRYWHRIKPKKNAQLLLIATVKGFHLKPLLSALAPLALSIAAPWAGGLVAGSGLLQSAVSAGVMAGGSALTHHLLPPPKPNALSQHSLSSSHRLSPTYDITGGSNRARFYQPLPLVFGKHKLIPDLAAIPFTQHENKQALYHVLLTCGVGHLTLNDIKIGHVPITQCDNVRHQIIKPNEPNTLWQTHYRSTPGGELIPQGDWLVRTTPKPTTQLRVELQYQLYTVHRHNRHIAPLNCQIQLHYRKVTNTIQSSQQEDDQDNHHDGIDGTDNHSKTDDVKNAEKVTSDEAMQPTSSLGVWQPFTIKHDATQPQVAPQPKGFFVIHDANLQSKVLVFTMDVPQGFYEVRMKRLTPDFISPAVGKLTWLQLLSADQDSETTKALIEKTDQSTRIALQIQASEALHNTLDAISVVAEHPINQNNNPKSHTLDPVLTQSANPAAQCLALARGMRQADQRCWGGGLALKRIDLNTFITWGKWCEQQQLECHVVFDQPQTVWQQLEIIARCGCAKPVWDEGKLSVLIDRQDCPVVQHFSEHDIVLDSLKMERRSQPNIDEIVVRFINQDKDWQHDELRVSANDEVTPAVTHTMELLGVTSKSQVRQAGLHVLTSSQQTVYYQWQSPTSRICVQVGDCVTLQCHPILKLPTTVQLTKCRVHDSVGQFEAVKVDFNDKLIAT